MRVYFEPSFRSRSIERVATNLRKYLPDHFEEVSDPKDADLVVLHVIGRRDQNLLRAAEVTGGGAKYAVIQYVLQSSRNPDPADWATLWDPARVVWSYYDLPAGNLYRAPLAADPEVFLPQQTEKKYLVGTAGDSGHGVECLGEVRLAAYLVGGTTAHVGQSGVDPVVEYFSDVTDDQLSSIYNSCTWWSSLRRKDGFEMTAVEALLCGVRPIVFDTPGYRKWFDGLAEFVPEAEPGELVGHLKKIFEHGAKPVTRMEVSEARRRFRWQHLVEGFWERCTN